MAIPVNVAFFGQTSVVELPSVRLYEEEEHTANRTVTRYPVESGAQLVDHAIRNPMQVVLRGFVPDAPSSDFVSGTRQQLLEGGDTGLVGQLDGRIGRGVPRRTWERLLRFLDNEETMTIVTNLGRYENMILERVDTRLNSRTGVNLEFEARFVELQYATELVGLSDEINANSGPAANRGAEVDTGYDTTVASAFPGTETDFANQSGVGTETEVDSSTTVTIPPRRSQITATAIDELRKCLPQGHVVREVIPMNVRYRFSSNFKFRRVIEGRDIEFHLKYHPSNPIEFWSIDITSGNTNIKTSSTLSPCVPIMAEGNASGLSGDFYVVRVRNIPALRQRSNPSPLSEESLLYLHAFGTGGSVGEYDIFYIPNLYESDILDTGELGF